MGANRTLVLYDGRRFTPTTNLGTVDLNLLPSMLTGRTEVVTGGASAAYGADAVAGVINIIPDVKYKGLKAELRTGITEQGDAREFRAAVAGGMDFAGGRGHIIASFEYENNKAAGDCYSRDWCQKEWGAIAVSPAGTNGLPFRNYLTNVHNSTAAPGGLITTTALRGTQFLGGQATGSYIFGSPISTTAMAGGSGKGEYYLYKDTQLQMPVKRYLGYVRAGFEFNDSLEGFISANYGHLDSQARVRQVDFGSLVINTANPFLPQSVRDQAAAAGITSFRMGRLNEDINPQQLNETEMYQGTIGLKGSIGDNWNWDGFYQYGHSKLVISTIRNRITANFNKALDARLNGAGQIVCGVNADANPNNDDAACVPINLFGSNQYSQDAFNYAYGTGVVSTTIKEHVAGLNLNGSLFNTWAGPVTVAVGGEYRRDTISGGADPLSAARAFAQGNGDIYKNTIEVIEGYVEANVPLAKELPFAYNLELNGAARRTHYNVSGSINTWKVGAIYEPVRGVRFRVTQSRDIRAPNANELFGGSSSSTAQITDTRGPGNPNGTGQAAPINAIQNSNPNLTPEKADTFTAGIVLQPHWLIPNLTLSVDYYNIKLANAVGRLGSANIVDRCAAGALEFCSLLTRDPTTGLLTEVQDTYLNFGGMKARGIDFEANYFTPLTGIGLPGQLTAQLFISKAIDLITTDSAGSVDRAGQLALLQGVLAGPALRGDFTMGYDSDALNVTLQTRFIDSGHYDVTHIGPDDPRYNVTLPNSSSDNTVSGRVYQNLNITYRLKTPAGRKFEFFGSVNNLWDRDPPVAPSSFSSTSPAYFDVLGRAYRVGVRVEF
jgi:outer membrane receptor protein involved in Fe transport